MKTWIVKIPLAGHTSFEVEAETQEEAIAVAKTMDPDDGETCWESLDAFSRGNVCYCPQPWKTTAKEIS